MKLTTTQIKNLVKEELEKVMKEVDQGYRKDIKRIAEVFKVIKKFPDNVRVTSVDSTQFLDQYPDQEGGFYISLQLQVHETKDYPMDAEYQDQTSCSDLAEKVIRKLVYGLDFVDTDQMEKSEFDYDDDVVRVDFSVSYENKKGMYEEDVHEAAEIAGAEDRYF